MHLYIHELGRFDSAKIILVKPLPYFEQQTSESNKINFYLQLANMYKRTGSNDKAIEYYQKIREIG